MPEQGSVLKAQCAKAEAGMLEIHCVSSNCVRAAGRRSMVASSCYSCIIIVGMPHLSAKLKLRSVVTLWKVLLAESVLAKCFEFLRAYRYDPALGRHLMHALCLGQCALITDQCVSETRKGQIRQTAHPGCRAMSTDEKADLSRFGPAERQRVSQQTSYGLHQVK